MTPGSARVAIVGGGVMGAWSGLWLRRCGLQVQLVDAYGPGNSLSSSGDESRVTRSAHGLDEVYPVWQRRALDAWLALEAEADQRLVVRTGVLWLAHDERGAEAESLATLRRLAIPAERLALDDLVARFPQIATHRLAWALLEPEGGVLLARRAVAAVAEALARVGDESRIGRALPPGLTDGSGGRLARLRLADGTNLEADAFVLAAGPWLPGLVPDVLGGDQLAVTRQEVVYLATPPGDARFSVGELPTWVDHRQAVYGLPSIEGRGMKVAPDWPGETVDPDTLDRRLSDAAVEAVRGFLRERMPAMAEQPVVESRVCQYATTLDTHFIIDRHPAWENVWIVGGGSGHAFKHGPVIGEYLAALVTGDSQAASRLAPRDERFALRRRSSAAGMRTSASGPPTQHA